LALSPEQSLRRIRVRVELALVEVGELFEELPESEDPKATLRRMILALGRISPVLEDLDRILATALLDREYAADAPQRAAEAAHRP